MSDLTVLTRVPVDAGRDEGRGAAVKELLRPIYHRDDPSLLDRAREWVARLLGQLIAQAVSVAPGGAWGLFALAVVVGAVIAVLLWRRGSPGRSRAAQEPILFEDDSRSAAEMRAAADRAAGAGDWTLAVQERFRAVIRGLEERTIIDERPGWTAHEAADAAGHPLAPLASDLLAGAGLFDRVTYGGRSAAAPDDEQLRDLDRAARAASPTREPRAADSFALPR